MPVANYKPAQQARSRRAEKALILAGMKGIESCGIAALSMADVAAEAGASIGSLYFRFGDKSQFVSAVLTLALEELHDRGFAMCEKAEREKWPQRRILEGWVSVIVASARERRTLIREMVSHMATRPDDWKPIHARRRQLERRLLAVLSTSCDGSPSPACKARLRIGLQVVAATLVHMVVVDPGPLRLDDRSVPGTLCDLLFSFIDAPNSTEKTRARRRRKTV